MVSGRVATHAAKLREVAPQKFAANRLLAMKHPAASGWLPIKWPDAMPVHTSQAVTVIVMLIALTFKFIFILSEWASPGLVTVS